MVRVCKITKARGNELCTCHQQPDLSVQREKLIPTSLDQHRWTIGQCATSVYVFVLSSAYPWCKELDKDGLALRELVVIVGRETGHIKGRGDGRKGENDSGSELHVVLCVLRFLLLQQCQDWTRLRMIRQARCSVFQTCTCRANFESAIPPRGRSNGNKITVACWLLGVCGRLCWFLRWEKFEEAGRIFWRFSLNPSSISAYLLCIYCHEDDGSLLTVGL